MDVFTVTWGRSWLVRLFGRNPLVRGCDRLETFAVATAVMAVLIAVPVVAAVVDRGQIVCPRTLAYVRT